MAPLVSMLSWQLLSSLLLVFLLILLNQRSKPSRPHRQPPGPFKLPLIGNLHLLGSSLHRSLWQLSKKHGPIMHLQLGSVPAVVVSSPAMAREVLKTHDLYCSSRPQQSGYRRISYNYLDVVFAPYGDYWRQMRKICTVELFSMKRVQSFSFIREEEVAQLMKNIFQSSQNGKPVNLSELMFSFITNVTCRTAFGSSYQEGDGWKSRCQEMIEESQFLAATLFLDDFIPFTRWVDVITGKHARVEKNYRDLDEFYEEVIEEHLRPQRSKLGQEDLVDVLLGIQKADPNLTTERIKGVLMDILIGGTETSSVTVVWAMTELMRKRKLMQKAQDEVRKVAGTKGKVEESDVSRLHYLKLVVKETFRLHPPAPLLVLYETTQDFTIEGYDILAKTTVMVNIFAIGRDPKAWENPNEFLPERFLRSSIDFKGTDFELLPFGAGRRMCPGVNMGIASVELALANLLCCFDWEVPQGMGKEVLDLEEEPGMTCPKKFPLILVPTVPVKT